MYIFLMVVGYLIVGLVSGSAFSRVGYSTDKDVREAARELTDADHGYLEVKDRLTAAKDGTKLAPGIRVSDIQYERDRAWSRLLDARSSSHKVFMRNRDLYTNFGVVVFAVWPLAVVGLSGWYLGKLFYRLIRKGTTFAFSPGQYESHSQLVKGDVQ